MKTIKAVEPATLNNYNRYYEDIFDVLNPIDDVNEDCLIFDKNKPLDYNNLVNTIRNCQQNE